MKSLSSIGLRGSWFSSWASNKVKKASSPRSYASVEVVLVVDRAGKTFKQNVTLARRPPENLGEDDGLDPEALFRDFLRRKQDEKAPAPAKAKP